MQKAMILVLMMFSVTAEGILIEGLQAAEEPTFWDMGEGEHLEKYSFNPHKSDVKSMKAGVKSAEEMDHAERIKAIAGGLLKDGAATTEEQRKTEELADVTTFAGKSMRELAQEQLAKKKEKPEKKPEQPEERQEGRQEEELAKKPEQPEQKQDEKKKKLSLGSQKIAAKEKELQELTADIVQNQVQEEAKPKKDKKEEKETLEKRHARQEEETAAQKAVQETATSIAAKEQELQDLYKQQLDELIPHAKSKGGHSYQARRENEMLRKQEEKKRETRIAAMANERLEKVKGAVVPEEAGEWVYYYHDEKDQKQFEKQQAKEQKIQEKQQLVEEQIQQKQLMREERAQEKQQLKDEAKQQKQQAQEEKSQHKQELKAEQMEAKKALKEELKRVKVEAKAQAKDEMLKQKKELKEQMQLEKSDAKAQKKAQMQQDKAGQASSEEYDFGALDADDGLI